MGKKGSWFSSIKKALSPHSKEKKNQKLKKKGLGDEKPPVSITKPVSGSHDSPPLPPPEEAKPIKAETEQKNHAYMVASDAAATTTQAAAKPTQLSELSRYSGKSIEETASIRIQTAFRGYLARRALRALRGLVRLKNLIEGPTGERQTAATLKSMQNLSRVQCQINSRRIRMSEENQALQRQLLQKQAKELETSQTGEEWNDSLQSKEQIEAKLLSKHEATMRRERAMAYSFSHQQPWKKSARTTNLLFMDPTNPQWGWSWLERYMAGRPWETQGEKNQPSVKNGINITGTEIARSYLRHQLSSTPKSTAHGAVASQKFRRWSNSRTLRPSPDDDSRSVFSSRSEMKRRHSIAGSSVRDDESMDSSASVPGYMAQTKSAKAKAKGQSLLGPLENGPAEMEFGAKKRLSFPGPPARPRRHSGPPKVQSDISMVV